MAALRNRKDALMILSRIVFVALIAVLPAGFTAAQTRRPGARPATAKPAATPTPLATPQPTPAPSTAPASAPIAIVNGVTISAGEIEDNVSTAMTQEQDQYFRDYYNDRAKAIREARQRALDARLNSMLIEAEAKKRGKTSSELIESEINAKIGPPSDEELKSAYDANREQIGGASLESVRAELVNFIRNQKSQQLYTAWLTRLKMTNVVSKNGDVNAPNLAPGTVVGAVNGAPLRIETINERMKAYVYKMEMRLYEMREDFLNRRINNQLINAEAEKRKVGSEEVFRVEVTDRIKPPTDVEVKKFFDENKDKISGDLDSNRTFIVTILQQQQQQKLEVALVEKLRAGAKIQVMLPEPEPPVMNVGLGSGASRGDVNAAVTIVEFTDFQCPACGGMYPIVEDMLKTYGDRVHFVLRNYPLTALHVNAFKAAQAAEAAKAQGKYWEYIDLLFKNQSSLDVDSLKKFATQVGLDRKRFDAELDSGKYEPLVRRDMEEGDNYGIEGTPTFYINGVILTEYSAEGLRNAIEKAFARAKRS
jgi:protein-disulfide isomerase